MANQIIDLAMSPRKQSKRPAVVRDKEATTATILSAAETEFARYGLPGARVEAIARAAGVTKGLILYYYKTKEQLYEAVLRHRSEPIQALLAEVEASKAPPADLLQFLVERVLQTGKTNPLTYLLFMLEFVQNKGEYYRKLNILSLPGTIERVLARGVKQGCFRKLDATHAAINILGLCMFYFCVPNLPDPSPKRNSHDEERFARHAGEVMSFVEARTAPVGASHRSGRTQPGNDWLQSGA